jgi:hypothetical protein
VPRCFRLPTPLILITVAALSPASDNGIVRVLDTSGAVIPQARIGTVILNERGIATHGPSTELAKHAALLAHATGWADDRLRLALVGVMREDS